MFHILITEDEYSLRELMSDYLCDNGYEVLQAQNGVEALALLDRQHIDLLICDIMMPQMDGLTLTQELRTGGFTLPILLVTARETLADKREGFLAGADDYMVKPIDFEEMLLRVTALLRRAQSASEHRLQCGNVIIDYDSLTVTAGDESITLPKKELQLLFKLLCAPNQTFTRRQLMDDIWGPDSDAEERTVDVHIKRLREKLGHLEAFAIRTVRGLGYRAERAYDAR